MFVGKIKISQPLFSFEKEKVHSQTVDILSRVTSL